MTVGRNTRCTSGIRDMREDRDLPQRALAELLHVSQATYSRYESGGLDVPSGALIAWRSFTGPAWITCWA